MLRLKPIARASVLGLALLAACSSTPRPAAQEYAPEPDEGDEDITTAMSGVRYVTVPERFLSAAVPEENVDSPASWQAPDGRTWVIATGKATDRLLVLDGDSGALLRHVGRSGEGAGEFDRPNGVFVVDDLLFVVERDNRRVQVLRLPDFEPLGHFGATELQKPYGLWLRPADGGYDVLVSDAYMSEADDDVPPPLAQLGRRYKRYAVRTLDDAVQATLQGTLGATDAAGAIRTPESLWGDPAHDRLLLAEEDPPTGTRLREYHLDGRYRGRDLGAGLFRAQAEGLALWACADGSGYWLATDQYKDRSVFHVFDRVTLAHRGAFAGRTTANTDGVWLQQAPTRAFPAGVFYAVHDDQAIAAFDWRDLARALGLRRSCPAGG